MLGRHTPEINNSRELITQALPEGCCSLKKDIFAVQGRCNDFALEWSYIISFSTVSSGRH